MVIYDKPRSRNEKGSIQLKNIITCKEGNIRELKKKFTFEMKDKSGPRTYFQCTKQYPTGIFGVKFDVTSLGVWMPRPSRNGFKVPPPGVPATVR